MNDLEALSGSKKKLKTSGQTAIPLIDLGCLIRSGGAVSTLPFRTTPHEGEKAPGHS
jgi:hypothetical protein